MKRIFYMLIVLIFLLLNLSALCVSAEISGDYEYKIEDGKARIINYKGVGGDVDIPSTLDGYPVTGIGNATPHSFGASFGKFVTSITIPNSVTYIGNGVFKDCTNLTSVTIPDSVTLIGEDAFSECTALTSVTIPESVTSIGRLAFRGCTGLTSVNILNRVIGESMFSNCSALTTVNMGENLTYIGVEAFSNCKAIETIIIPESVTKVDYGAFVRCSSLTNVIFNNPNTEFKETPGQDSPLAPLVPTFYRSDNLSTIYAFSGSQAQRYSLDKQLNFVPIARVQLNGQKLKFDVPPIIVNGRVLVPIRKIFETFGAEIGWDNGTGTVTAATSGKSIIMQIDNPQMQVNGERMTLDVSPQIILDRTLAPVRAVSESLGATVEWDKVAQTVIINTQ